MSIFLSLLIINLSGFEIIKPIDAYHEFHLSKCEVEFNQDEKSLEIALQLFIDDTELALSNIGHDSLRLFDEKESPEADLHIHAYIRDHFEVFVDNHKYELSWLGKEISEDLAGLWCYLTIEDVSPTDHIRIKNDLLMETFEDQQNIVKLKYDRKQKAYFLFDTQVNEGTLTLD